MSMYFDLFVKYIKVQLIVSHIKKPSYYLSAYAKAYECINGSNEPNLQRLSNYLKLYYDTPLLSIRNQTQKISDNIGNALLQFTELMIFKSNSEYFLNKNTFDILYNQKNMHLPINESFYSQLMDVNTFRTWVLYIFLVCPTILQRDQAKTLLTYSLKQDFVIPIHRDIVLTPCEKYANLFDTFKLNSFNLKKHKKCVKDAYNDYENTLKSHHKMRTFLRVTCSSLYEFFTEFNAAIAPKILMILAIIRLGRDEVLWYFRHLNALPYKQKKLHH